jgi:hypothetical protein
MAGERLTSERLHLVALDHEVGRVNVYEMPVTS